MLKKTINYTNADGHPAQDDVYFNLTKAELVKMAVSEGEGFQDYLNRIVESGDGKAIIETFERILEMAYGERIAGKFSKTPGAFEAFKTTEAYSELFMEIVTDAKKSAEFIAGLMPNELSEAVAKSQAGMRQVQDVIPTEISNSPLPNVVRAAAGLTKNPEDMTEEELLESLGVQERVTNGYTDATIAQMSSTELAKAGRDVLVRAFQLKNQK